MKKNFLLALLLIAAWSGCAGLIWRLVFRASVMSISDPSLRSFLGTMSFAASALLSYWPVNLLYRRLGNSGSFVRWAFDIFDQVAGRKR